MSQNKNSEPKSIRLAFITSLQWNVLSKLCLALLCIYFVQSADEEFKDENISGEKGNVKTEERKKTASELFLEDIHKNMSYKEFRQILFENMIIPDCIDVAPKHSVQVQFYHGHIVNLGNLIPPKNITNHSPHFVKWPGNINEFFTLIMVDLDEPQRLYPDEREWLHWMIVNIPGWTRYLGELKARYVPPQPMEDSGKHRYVFVVYKQPKKINFSEVELINGTKHNAIKRGHFSCRLFAKKYDLGDPWAINFFEAEHQF